MPVFSGRTEPTPDERMAAEPTILLSRILPTGRIADAFLLTFRRGRIGLVSRGCWQSYDDVW